MDSSIYDIVDSCKECRYGVIGESHKKGVAGQYGTDYWKPSVKCKHPEATHKPYEGKTKPKSCPLAKQ